MSHKTVWPEVYFPSTPEDREVMVKVIDRILAGNQATVIDRVAIPRKGKEKKVEEKVTIEAEKKPDEANTPVIT